MDRIRTWLPLVPALALAVAIGVVFGLPDRPGSGVVALAPSVPAIDIVPATITLHVSGEVIRPGLVVIPAESRVADAVLAAGGATPGADLTGVNLARRVADGEQLVIPARGPDGGPPQAGSTKDGKIAVNRATAEELETLPGVGPVMAARIVAHREANGRFENAEDLLDVSGIGERTLATLRDLIVVP